MSNRKKRTLGIGFNEGATLMYLAKTYPSLKQVIAEIVQNGVDCMATRVDVIINLQKRTLSVYDNGTGCGHEMFNEALHSINSSLKTKSKSKYGRYGRGLMSPLSIAKIYRFTSCPAPHANGYVTYDFNAAEIELQKVVEIPYDDAPELHFEPEGKIWWRTRVECSQLIKDRSLTKVDTESICDDIVVKYGDAIRDRKIDITISLQPLEGERVVEKVVAPEYRGTKLEVYEATNKDAGKVHVELYLALLGKQGKKGMVTFGTMDNPSRLSASQFIKCTEDVLPPEIARGLTGGVFEGKILCQNVSIHPDRERFNDSDALFGLCEVLEKWYLEIGEKILVQAKEKASDKRFQEIGASVMPFAELMLRQPSFRSVADQISIGTIGKGHAKPPKGTIIGDTSTIAKAIFPPGDPRNTPGGSTDPKGDDGGGTKPKERPRRTPGIIHGIGKKRTEVKGSSTGLRFEYVELDDFRVPFEYDPETGTLSFNTNSPEWGLCQKSDQSLIDYQVAIVTSALSLELVRRPNEALDESLIHFAREHLCTQVFTILRGDDMIAKR